VRRDVYSFQIIPFSDFHDIYRRVDSIWVTRRNQNVSAGMYWMKGYKITKNIRVSASRVKWIICISTHFAVYTKPVSFTHQMLAIFVPNFLEPVCYLEQCFSTTGPLSYKKKNLPSCGLTTFENHWLRR
jgi:hypothetical protein